MLPYRGLVLTSASKEEKSYGATFLDKLVESYLQKQIFRKKKIVTGEYDSKIKILLVDPTQAKYGFMPLKSEYGIKMGFIKPPEGKTLFEDMLVNKRLKNRRKYPAPSKSRKNFGLHLI